MNFDDLKSGYQSLSFSGGENIDFTKKVENVLEQVRKEDKRDKQGILRVVILIAAFGLGFCVLGIQNYSRHPEEIGYWSFVLFDLTLISAIPFLINKYRHIKELNYNVPVIEFIDKVEKRFAFFQAGQLLLIPSVIFLNASFVFINARSGITIDTILRSQFFFLMVVAFALLIRMIAWRKKVVLLEELCRIKESLK